MGLQLGALTPAFYAFRDREYVLNLIEAVTGGRFHPNFDRIGGLKDDLPEGLDRRDASRRWSKIRDVLRRDRGPRSSATRSSRPAPAASASSPPRSALSYGLSGANLARQRRRLGPAPRRPAATSRTTSSTGRSGPTPTATRSPATGCGCRRRARPRKIVDQLLDSLPSGPIMAKVPRIIKVPEGEAWVEHREPARRDGLLRRLARATRPVPGEDPLGRRSTTSRSCRGCCAACTCPTSSRSSPASTSSSGTSTGDATLLAARHRVLGHDARDQDVVVVLVARAAHRAASSSTSFLFKMMSYMQSRLGPMEAGPHGSMPAPRRGGKFLQKEDIIPERGRPARLRARAVVVVLVDVPARSSSIPFGPDAVVRRPRRRRLLRARGVVALGASACSWPAGRAPTSTR